MLRLLLRSLEFDFYHSLLSVVDRVSKLPRNTTMPEAARLYRENIALKAQLDVLQARPQREEVVVKPCRRRRSCVGGACAFDLAERRQIFMQIAGLVPDDGHTVNTCELKQLVRCKEPCWVVFRSTGSCLNSS